MAKLLYLYLRTFEKTHYVPPHLHSFYELIYYVKESGYSFYANQSIETKDEITFDQNISLNTKEKIVFKDHQFVVFPPFSPHDEHADGYAEIVSVGFVPEDEYEKSILDLVFHCHEDEGFNILRYVRDLENEYIGKKHGYKSMMDTILRSLLITISRKVKENTTSTGLDYIARYLQDYYMENVSIKELANKCGYSESHFRLLFKNKFGCSPKQYILDNRYNHILLQLQGNTPLEDVALHNGFKDYYQFSSFFKERSGMSPTKYRNEQHEKIKK